MDTGLNGCQLRLCYTLNSTSISVDSGLLGLLPTSSCRRRQLQGLMGMLWGVAGSIKRWGMARGNMTHGSKSKRQHGSIGNSASPSRVFPGLHMAGHMGAKRVKVRKLKVGTLVKRLSVDIIGLLGPRLQKEDACECV